MPVISRFYGIVISMYYLDHAPPHIHVYGDGEHASVAIDDGRLLKGSMKGRTHALVRLWLLLHREECMLNWQRAQEHEPLQTIDPLP